MILFFPNVETLQLALTSGVVAPDVSAAAASAAFVDGAFWIETAQTLSRPAQNELRQIGVGIHKKCDVPLSENLSCWPQLLSMARATTPEVTDKTTVLFELPDATHLPELAGEILRLGNDRQGFRFLGQSSDAASTDRAAPARALLQVNGPPYYSLLRAFDRRNGDSAIAYREVNPDVWIEMGWSHPLEEQLAAPEGKLLFLRGPRTWTVIDKEPFRDLYEILEFKLAQPATTWHAQDLQQHIAVPLRLVRGGPPPAAEMWVLRNNALEQLRQLVSHMDERIVGRLAFAVAEKNDQLTVVLRVRPSKQAPPVLVLDAVGYRSYLRIPNLFLPVGTRLHPPLRRDAVLKLLAADADQLVWLFPDEQGGFTPEAVPDSSFRPLDHWVDYVLDREHEALQTWLCAHEFQFESFVCKDQPAKKPKKDPRRTKPDHERPDDGDDKAPTLTDIAVIQKPRKRSEEVDTFVEPAQELEPNILEEQLREIEGAFLESGEPIDGTARKELWEQMAALNAGLNYRGDAAICFANVLWREARTTERTVSAWCHSECGSAGGPGAEKLQPFLDTQRPTHEDMRLLVVFLLRAATARRAVPQLGQIQHCLELNENMLGIRAVWLAWLAIHAISGGDPLALARARDRILERLFTKGLSADLDLPPFLRFKGRRGNDHFRGVREQVLRMRTMAQKWARRGFTVGGETPTYIDLIFAFGLARLGESGESDRLLQSALAFFEDKDQQHRWLARAYEYRIRQAMEGKPMTHRLSDALMQSLDSMYDVKQQIALNQYVEPKKIESEIRLNRYIVDRLRQHSRILEPHERLNPYRAWTIQHADELTRKLTELWDTNSLSELREKLADLLAGKGVVPKGKKLSTDDRARIIATALELAPRLGEAFSLEPLEQVEPVLDQLSDPLLQANLIEKGLFLAAHFDHRPKVLAFLDRFHALLDNHNAALPLKTLESLVAHSFRGLRKLGLRDEISRILGRIHELVLAHEEMKSEPTGGSASQKRCNAECLLLQVAGGWYYFGQEERARPIVDRARKLLFQGIFEKLDQATFACAYVTALGQAPVELAISRFLELFNKLQGVHDAFTTNSHYSRTRLDVVEAVILAVSGDDFAFDKEARRWLDEDEYFVRKRIHADLRAAVGQS